MLRIIFFFIFCFDAFALGAGKYTDQLARKVSETFEQKEVAALKRRFQLIPASVSNLKVRIQQNRLERGGCEYLNIDQLKVTLERQLREQEIRHKISDEFVAEWRQYFEGYQVEVCEFTAADLKESSSVYHHVYQYRSRYWYENHHKNLNFVFSTTWIP